MNERTRKEFEEMAKKDEYIEAAYGELKKLSMDEQKRIEYEARQKAIRDYNTQMNGAREEGLEQGERLALQKLIRKKEEKGMSLDEIAELLEMEPQEVSELMEESRQEDC